MPTPAPATAGHAGNVRVGMALLQESDDLVFSESFYDNLPFHRRVENV
jgi:hypothetical protein